MEKIPVILDTDIGGDIDDMWALGMLLKSPDLAEIWWKVWKGSRKHGVV